MTRSPGFPRGVAAGRTDPVSVLCRVAVDRADAVPLCGGVAVERTDPVPFSGAGMEDEWSEVNTSMARESPNVGLDEDQVVKCGNAFLADAASAASAPSSPDTLSSLSAERSGAQGLGDCLGASQGGQPAPNGLLVVCVSRKSNFRRLHQVGVCTIVPWVDLWVFSAFPGPGPPPPSAYDAHCRNYCRS